MARSDTQFKSGSTSNGRPKGARNKFSQAFIKDFAKNWKENGPQAIDKLRETKLEAYVKTGASLVPKDLDVNLTGNINISVIDYAEGDE